MNSFNILLVEDSPTDVLLTRETFVEGKLRGKLYSVASVQEAWDFLTDRIPKPDLILLDLNLPGSSGYELLKEIKSDPDLKALPVVVLTASHDIEDVQKSYRLGANSLVSKPIDLYEFMCMLQSLEEYWLEVATLPNLHFKRKDHERKEKKAKKGGKYGSGNKSNGYA